jgi:hypothetical protein
MERKWMEKGCCDLMAVAKMGGKLEQWKSRKKMEDFGGSQNSREL